MDIYFNNSQIGSTSICFDDIALPDRIDCYTSHKVNDELRGYLISEANEWKLKFELQKNNKPIKDKVIKRLALILESPHMSEYDQVKPEPILNPIGPAKGDKVGSAGYAINNLVAQRNWTEKLEEDYIYEIYIMNAIQYQCSAANYIPNYGNRMRKVLRDEIFTIMWRWDTRYFYNNLKFRIEAYNPDVVINCCTGMSNYKETEIVYPSGLAIFVENAIWNTECYSKFQYYCDLHPAVNWK